MFEDVNKSSFPEATFEQLAGLDPYVVAFPTYLKENDEKD
jgi:hypothetical protein